MRSHAPVREYVNMELTPELEEAVTETLFTLRNLRMQELGLGQKSRRYAVGFREVRRETLGHSASQSTDTAGPTMRFALLESSSVPLLLCE